MTLELCLNLEKFTSLPFLLTAPYNLRMVICLKDGQDPLCPSPWLYWPLLVDSDTHILPPHWPFHVLWLYTASNLTLLPPKS